MTYFGYYNEESRISRWRTERPPGCTGRSGAPLPDPVCRGNRGVADSGQLTMLARFKKSQMGDTGIQPPGGGALRELRQSLLGQADILHDVRLDAGLLAGREEFFNGRLSGPDELIEGRFSGLGNRVFGQYTNVIFKCLNLGTRGRWPCLTDF